jgi:hypothetical protein
LKSISRIVIAGTLLGATMIMNAQTAAVPGGPAMKSPTPAGDIQHSYAGLKANILKAANNMPADAFTFRPTPDVRTFARVVNHISEAQLNSCGAMNKTAPADRYKVPPETADKAAIVAALQASFAECDKAYGALTDTNLMDPITVGAATRIRVSIAWGNVSHDNEQYATLALYMRLKGLVPPSSEK